MIDVDVEGTPDLDDDDAREAWHVRSDREATWALRKLALAEHEHDRIAQAAADEIDAIKAWRDAALAGPARDAAFFTQALVAYRMGLEDADPDLPKTYKVPGGTIARRKQQDLYRVADEAAFIAWALEHHPELLHIESRTSGLKDFAPATTTPGVVGAYQLVTDDGEMVPGAELVVRPDAYSAKTEASP